MKGKIIGVFMLILIVASIFATVMPTSASSSNSGDNAVSSQVSYSGTGESTQSSPRSSLDLINSLDSEWRRIFEKPSGTNEGASLENLSQPVQNGQNNWTSNASRWGNVPNTGENETRLVVGVNSVQPTSFSDLEEIAAKYQAKTVNTVSMGGKVKAIVVELSPTLESSFSEEVRSVGLASYVEPSMKVEAQFTPNDPYWNLQWGPQKIEADWAWNTTMGSNDVLVAVVDTGIDYHHPDLASRYVPLGYDWVNMDSDPLDDFGHGTHVAGIIAATLNNTIGVAGVAQVRVMAEKVLDDWGSGYYDWVANGIIHAADQGANIISMSFGGYGDSEIVHEAIKYAYDKGVLLIASAGNDATNMKSYPAAYDEVVAVAATDQYDDPAYFSNWGDWIELAAPGVDIYSTLPTYRVTLNEMGYPMNYGELSGTSMACPHVTGVAALAWSRFANRSRDWVRLWLRHTADDLGSSGFDTTYGYGRVNAREVVEQAPPSHELIAYDWKTPKYLEPGATGTVNATILNFGENDETNVVVQLMANGTIIDSEVVSSVLRGSLAEVSLTGDLNIQGCYNITLYIVPVFGEENPQDNVLSKYVYVGFPTQAVVLHSAGNVDGDIITNWQAMTDEWYLFGDTMVYIDYTTLNKDDITYADIAATHADVLIISCAYDRYSGWEFSDSEIEAITRYVHEGHGLIATAGTLYNYAPNNNKLAPLFGLKNTTIWTTSSTDLLHLLNRTNPVLSNVPNPLVFPAVGSALPEDRSWDSNELDGGKYLAMGHYQESAIVTYKGLVYISPWFEVIPPYYYHHLKLLYNAMVWSRYQKPPHELVASLEAPRFLKSGKSALLNATVSNFGSSNETNVDLQLWINTKVADVTVPILLTGASYRLSYFWTPASEGTYNVTAYAPPLPSEEYTFNNKASFNVKVRLLWTRVAVLNSMEIPSYFMGGWSNDYQTLVDALNAEDFDAQAVTNKEILEGILSSFDVLVLIGNVPNDASVSRVFNFWSNGGGIVAFDSSICFLNYAGILPSESAGRNGYGVYWAYGTQYQAQIAAQHPVTEGYTVGQIVSGASGDALYLVGALARTSGYRYYTTLAKDLIVNSFAYASAYEPSTGGRVVHIWDHSHWRNVNLQLMISDAMAWANTRYAHDLAASLDSPEFLEPSDSTLLNSTVRNVGLNNETVVTLQLLINSTVVKSTVIPELAVGGSYTFSYLWTPTIEGTYNITVYAPPSVNETHTTNNRATELCTVMKPLIHPLEGQYANYTIYYIDPNTGEKIFGGSWDFMYLHYVSPQLVNITMQATDPWNVRQSGWMIVNVFNKVVQESHGAVDWTGMWYPGWIETNVKIGSTVRILSSNATIVDSGVVLVGDLPIDCWKAQFESYGWVYSFLYDKASGLWVGMTVEGQYQNACLALTATDIPIGFIYAHDLAVALEIKKMLQVGVETLVNATVYNTGLNEETSVRLQLSINGFTARSEVISELASGDSYTFSYPWTPSANGLYNVTVYASPVLGEEYTENNFKARAVTVGPIQVALISDYGELLFTVSVFDSMGINYDTYNGNSAYLYTANLSLLLKYRVVVFYKGYRGITSGEQLALNSYLNRGGNLIVTGLDSLSSDTRLADVVRSFSVGDDVGQPDLVVANQFHPIMNGPNGSFSNGYRVTGLYSDCDRAMSYASRNSISVAQLADGFDKIIATEGIPGKVVFWNGRGDLDWMQNSDCQAMFKNTMHWMLTTRDVAIVDIVPSASRVHLGNTFDITVIAQNQGNFSESFTVTVNATSMNSTRIYLDPSDYLFDSSKVYVGYKFNVTVRVHEVSDLSSWQIRMYYNNATINATRWFEPTWDPTYVFYGRSSMAVPSPSDVYRPSNDSLLIGSMLLGPGEGVSGDGLLAIIQFEIKAMPEAGKTLSSDLIIDNVETYLLDSYIIEIPSVKVNGYYAVSWGGIPPPPHVPGSYIIGIQTVTDLAPGANISLTFSWNTTGVAPKFYRISAEASVVPGEIDTADNLYWDGAIQVEEPPRASFFYSPEFPKAGQTIIFNASLSGPDSGEIVSYGWNFGDGVIVNTSDSVTTHTFASSGSFNVTLTIRDKEDLTDSISKIIRVFVRDVAVISVMPSTNRTYGGRTVAINVTVMNQGEVAENFTVTLYYNATAGFVIGAQNLTNVLPGEARMLVFGWNTTGVMCNSDYVITATVSIMPGETDIADNTLSCTPPVRILLLGDINGDGKVDIKDVAIVAKAFGSYPGHYLWNPDGDFNQDGKIDIRDLVIVAKNFGRG